MRIHNGLEDDHVGLEQANLTEDLLAFGKVVVPALPEPTHALMQNPIFQPRKMPQASNRWCRAGTGRHPGWYSSVLLTAEAQGGVGVEHITIWTDPLSQFRAKD
jgi:hypothetical protein